MNRDDVFFSDEVIVNSDEVCGLYYTRAPSDEYSLAKGNAPTGQRVCRFRQKKRHALRD